jgi:REP element-mobilizing transposase RayT
MGFAAYARNSGLTIWACAILPDHVHLVLSRHHLKVESIVIQFKGDATQQLIRESLHPFGDIKDKRGRSPNCFARGEWKVFLDSPEDIVRAIAYVNQNPIKEGKPPQRWSFVSPFDPLAV